MAEVVLTPQSLDDVARLIRTHSLPPDTRGRIRRSLAPLGRFPLLGAPLAGRWSGYRFILGPWRWMILVYVHDADTETVAVVTVQDGRSSASPTATG